MGEFDAVARQRMTAAGHMYTRGRQEVLAVLSELAAPATIPAILQASPGLVQSSVYRNLAVLEEAGLVKRIDVGEGRAYFELSEALTDDHHHHLVCRGCGGVADVSLSDQAEHALDQAFESAARAAGFRLEEHRVDLVGLCAGCA